MRGHRLGRLEIGGAVEHEQLVERAGRAALGTRAVVADDVVHDRVVEHFQLLERVDQPADVMVGVLHEPGVDLHLAREHRLEIIGHVDPRGDLFVAGGELGVGRNDAELLLARERLLAHPVPTLVELALVLVGPLLRHVVRRVRATGA